MSQNNFFLFKLDTSEIQTDNVISVVVKPVQIDAKESFLDCAYQNIGCKTVEVRNVIIGGQSVDAWCDEDYFVEDPERGEFAVIFHDGRGNQVPVFGAMLLTGVNDDGETISVPISKDDISQAMTNGEITVGHMQLCGAAGTHQSDVVH